ncbi:hypothetical protein LJK87_45405 [Paenibacillus sp. P25]|nr:hypothetical protein LJK87_45405 [Paenibacillus sp. P25]
MFLEGAISADYTQVKALTEKVTGILSQGKQVRIEKDGFALSFSIDGRNGVPSTGMYLNPGESGNLPSGRPTSLRSKERHRAKFAWTVRLRGSGSWMRRRCSRWSKDVW